MMVPHSFRYSSSPPMEEFDEKSGRRQGRSSLLSRGEKHLPTRPTVPFRTSAAPVKTPSKPVPVPQPERSTSSGAHSMPSLRHKAAQGTKRPAHNPHALPPAVAALLAVTAIPPRRPHPHRRKPSDRRRVSIDQLVNEWKSEGGLKPSYASSPALSMLLEDLDEVEAQYLSIKNSSIEDELFTTRSASCESMPSLDEDNKSILSLGSPSTPESLRSRKSSSIFRKDRPRSLPATEDCAEDHPLAPLGPVDADDDDFDEGLMLSRLDSQMPTPRPKPSFKSNLTTSLQALKKAAISSISALTTTPIQPPIHQRANSSASSPFFSDSTLWSHPYLFPRLSSEIRPVASSTLPSEAQRRYFNPCTPPLTFEEQEAPFQLALHAPYLAEQQHEHHPTIQMQTYARGARRKAQPARSRSSPPSSSEAARALCGGAGVRQREPRENGDFLRVVVLEMNMRRSGKLDAGRAKFWLPPRAVGSLDQQGGRFAEGEGGTPRRWVGVSAY